MTHRYLLAFALILASFTTASALTAICYNQTNVTLPDGSDDCMVTINPDWIDAGSYSATGGPLTTSVSPARLGIGSHTVRLRVSDGTQTNYCWGTVTVEDNVAPTFSCEPINIYLVAPDQPNVINIEDYYDISDYCGVENFTINVPDMADFGTDWYSISYDHVSGRSTVCSKPITIHDAEPQDYCDNNRNATYEHIDRVSLTGNGLNLSLGSGNDGGYRWHYQHNTATLFHGYRYTLRLRPGFRSGSPYRLYWRTYIDKNGDGDFTDSGELLNQWNGTGEHAFSFNSPGAFWGMSRIRVVMSYGGYATPCSGRWGEVEDISVMLRPYFFLPWPFGRGVSSDELALAVDQVEVTDLRPDEPWKAGEQAAYTAAVANRSPRAPVRMASNGQLRVFPNPISAGDQLTVSGLARARAVAIFNAGGQRVLYRAVGEQVTTERFSLPDLPAGAYFLRVITANGTGETRRLVVR